LTDPGGAPTERLWRGGAAQLVRLASPVLLGGSAVLLLCSAIAGWYTVSATSTGSCHQVSETLYGAWVGVTTSGPYCTQAGVGTFQSAGLTSTGDLYLVVLILTAVSTASAVVLGALVFWGLPRRHPRRFLAIGMVAIVACGLGPALLLAAQPTTICSDQGFKPTPLAVPATSGTPANQSSPPVANSGPACNGWTFFSPNGGCCTWTWMSTTGPWNSFVGSTSLPGAAVTWAPATGWYLELVSVAFIGSGVFLGRRTSA
jgi:hypothetical protein